MADAQQPVDFDARPPVPVSEYERMVQGVNTGYDLLFTLAHAFLRALQRPTLHLLVVGAGGGAEIARFLPANPGWRITGVDPSADMLALAQAKAAQLGVSDRVTLVRGTVEALPQEDRFDAATCIFVLHFLPDAEKLALLRGIAGRLRAEGPVLIGAGARVVVAGEDERLRDDVLGTWQQHGELLGVPAAQMAATITQVLAMQPTMTTLDGYVALLHEAGFAAVGELLRVMNGGISAWIAR
jgi:tRNA (cmo5U34)-methyltransferase